MKIDKIVFPTDFSANSLSALDFAIQLAVDNQAELHLVYCSEPATMPFVANPDFPLGIENDEDAELEYLRMICPARDDLKVEHHRMEGNPSKLIVKLAEDLKAGLIVMATHGRTGLGRVLMGSIAENVVRKSPCAVLIFRADQVKAAEKPDKQNPKA